MTWRAQNMQNLVATIPHCRELLKSNWPPVCIGPFLVHPGHFLFEVARHPPESVKGLSVMLPPSSFWDKNNCEGHAHAQRKGEGTLGYNGRCYSE